MKKISSLFRRDDNGKLTTEYHPDARWVVNGEGVATRKWDGTAVRIFDGVLWARYDAKHGKPLPPDFVPCQAPDPITGHHPGWVPATRPEDKWIREACGDVTKRAPGTYEAVGPKIGGNREKFAHHELIPHGKHVWYADEATGRNPVPRDYDGLVQFFTKHNTIEGVVWWRDLDDVECDKIKITGAALGVKRGVR